MRQIVAGLTGDSDGTGDLAVELSKTDPASLETGQDSEDDSGEPEDWVPDPVDADPGLRPPAPPGFACGEGPGIATGGQRPAQPSTGPGPPGSAVGCRSGGGVSVPARGRW